MRQPHLTNADFEAIKAATRDLVEANAGCERAAKKTRVSKTAISEYGSRSHDQRFIPADCIAVLEKACGDDIVTRELRQISFKNGIPLHPSDSFEFLAHLNQEVGVIAEVTIEAEKDGHWSYAEKMRWLKQARKIQAAWTRQIDAVAASMFMREAGD